MVAKKTKKLSRAALKKQYDIFTKFQKAKTQLTELANKVAITTQGIVVVNAPESSVFREPANKVTTYAMGTKKPNGFLLELAKDGNKTTCYLSAAAPGCFKGYHMHKVREANYVCIKGKVKVITYSDAGREEHILSADTPERLHIPTNTPTGISNEWSEEAWIVNYPMPAYDPELKNEQVDFTEEECENGSYK